MSAAAAVPWLLGAIVLVLVLASLVAFTWHTARRVEGYLKPEGRMVSVGGQALHVVELGAGPPVLMIHGLGGQTRHFTYALAGRIAVDHRVVMVDRPGSGFSPREADAPARVRVQAEVVARLAEHLGLDRPTVVGHSLGGAVALALALDHPGRVGALALVAPLTQVQHEPPAIFARMMLTSRGMRTLVGWTLATPLAILRRDAVLAALFAPDPPPPQFATRGGGLLSLRPHAFRTASEDLMAANDDLPAMVKRYPSLSVPVAVLYGRGDRILDPELHGERLVSAIPGATLAYVEGGHMLPLTAPEAVEGLVRQALERQRR